MDTEFATLDERHPDPRFHRITKELPVKWISNRPTNMDLLNLYKGPLKFENRDKICGECTNYYPDPNLGAHKGRCRRFGFKEVHEELSAEERGDYMEPGGKVWFRYWPGCPEFTKRDRLSRR